MPQRKPSSRSVTFRMPEGLYRQVELVAFAQLQAELGLDASVEDANVSELLRSLVAQVIEQIVAGTPGGQDALEGAWKQAEARDLEARLSQLKPAVALVPGKPAKR